MDKKNKPPKPQDIQGKNAIPATNTNRGSLNEVNTQPTSKRYVYASLIILFISFLTAIFYVFYVKNKLIPEPIPISAQKITPLPTLIPTSISDELINWQTYLNKEYGYEFMYPILNKYEPQREIGDASEIFCYLLDKSATPKSKEGTACIWTDYITQATLNTSGITYCEEYFNTDTKKCMVFKTATDNSFLIDWGLNVSDSDQKKAGAQISHPNGGKVVFYVQPVIDKSKELFLQILSTFKFLEQAEKLCTNCPLYSQPAPGWCDNGEIVAGQNIYMSDQNCFCPGPPECITNTPKKTIN